MHLPTLGPSMVNRGSIGQTARAGVRVQKIDSSGVGNPTQETVNNSLQDYELNFSIGPLFENTLDVRKTRFTVTNYK